MNLGAIIMTAVLSSATTAAGLFLLWRAMLMPDLERRARLLAEDATARASAELTEAGEALMPKVRQAVRDGIQDAFLTPPTDRIGQTARDVTSAGVTVVESSLRRIFGSYAATRSPTSGRSSGRGGEEGADDVADDVDR